MGRTGKVLPLSEFGKGDTLNKTKWKLLVIGQEESHGANIWIKMRYTFPKSSFIASVYKHCVSGTCVSQ